MLNKNGDNQLKINSEQEEVEGAYIFPNEISGKQQNELYYMCRDLFAGTVSGFAILVSGHPFDTIKVRMQMTNVSFMNIVSGAIKNEGIFSFYKGMKFPFYTVPLINAIVFGAYGFYHRMMGQGMFTPLTLSQGMCAGAFAGLVNSVVLSPVELIKCRQQMDYEGKMKGALRCALSIYNAEGIKGLYRGMISTVLREMPCYAAQFGTYEVTKNILRKNLGDSMINLQHLIAGGLSGLMCWVASYPQDVIKTRIQCDTGILPNERKYKMNRYLRDGGFIDCMKHINKTEGLIGFWRGFSACALGAIITNAVGFYAYEEAKSLFY